MVATPADQVAAVMVDTSPPVGRETEPAFNPAGVYWFTETGVALLVRAPDPVPTWVTARFPLTNPGTNARPAKFMLPFGLPLPVSPTNASVLKLPALNPWSTPFPDPAGAPLLSWKNAIWFGLACWTLLPVTKMLTLACGVPGLTIVATTPVAPPANTSFSPKAFDPSWPRCQLLSLAFQNLSNPYAWSAMYTRFGLLELPSLVFRNTYCSGCRPVG